MKLLIITLCLLSITFAQAQQGALGDVKYSILEPDKFSEKNGDGWVVMMGQSIKGSDLHFFTGLITLPDARGNFIRSMNMGREENGDTDGDRLVGSYQADIIKKHKHKFQKPTGYASHSPCGTNCGSFSGGFKKVEGTNQGNGGLETRPRNITLYTYIKINE